MAINLATKYAKPTVDALYKESVILGKTSNKYNWDGSKSIKVWTITTAPTTDYNRTTDPTTGSRYGATTEVQDKEQILTITQDKAVSLSVDKGNNKQQMMIKNAGKVMQLEMREQFVPEFDKYALNAWKNYSGIQTATDASLTEKNILKAVRAGVTALRNKNVKISNCYLYIGETMYAHLALAPEVLHLEKSGNSVLEKGVVGKVFGLQIVPVPDDYMPASTNFMIVNKDAVLCPTQIKDMKIHEDPVGMSGALLEVRWLYDAFVLETLKESIFASITA